VWPAVDCGNASVAGSPIGGDVARPSPAKHACDVFAGGCTWAGRPPEAMSSSGGGLYVAPERVWLLLIKSGSIYKTVE
jgi:hypothetical protein